MALAIGTGALALALSAGAFAQCVPPTPLPVCGAGEFLKSNGSVLSCVAGGGAALPPCAVGEVLTSDGTTLSCVGGGGGGFTFGNTPTFTTTGPAVVIIFLSGTVPVIGGVGTVAIAVDASGCATDTHPAGGTAGATCIMAVNAGSHTITTNPPISAFTSFGYVVLQ